MKEGRSPGTCSLAQFRVEIQVLVFFDVWPDYCLLWKCAPAGAARDRFARAV